MAFKNTLGIVVNSNRYFEFVTSITDAALSKGKQVRVCLLGDGIEYTRTEAYERLSRKTPVCLCADSKQTVCHQRDGAGGDGHFVPPQVLSSILQECYRYVVF